MGREPVFQLFTVGGVTPTAFAKAVSLPKNLIALLIAVMVLAVFELTLILGITFVFIPE